MPATVDAAFNQFISRLRTTAQESAAAASHRASIAAKLKERFGMSSLFRTGSFGNGTNVAGHSDVDYFAVIPTANLKQDSGKSLAEVAAALRERFPLTSNIRVDSPGVRVPFGLDGAEATEIVPVNETGRTQLGFRQFEIPDGNNGWMFSAPESHNAYVNSIDEQRQGKLKPLIRIMKAWKFKRNVPIKSFYLEIRTAQHAANENSIIYDIDVSILFKKFLVDGLSDFPDPRFPVDGFVLKACNTELQRQDALSKLANAAEWASDAVEHRRANRTRAAFGRWDLVFNYQFPPYIAWL